jgi:hypothetical protein
MGKRRRNIFARSCTLDTQRIERTGVGTGMKEGKERKWGGREEWGCHTSSFLGLCRSEKVFQTAK